MPADPTWLPEGARRRGRFLGLMSLVAGLGLLVASLLITTRHPGGDPGNTIFNRLAMVHAAIPASATAVRITSDPVQWFPGCGPGSRPGWGGELYSVDFTDTAPKIDVLFDINAVLVRQGWHPDATKATPSQGPLPRWLLDIKGDRPAYAFAYPVPAGSPHWHVSARWQTPGPQTQGCG